MILSICECKLYGPSALFAFIYMCVGISDKFGSILALYVGIWCV